MSGEKLTLPGGELTLDQNMTSEEKKLLENAVKSMKLDDFKKLISENDIKVDIQSTVDAEGTPVPTTKKVNFSDVINGKEDIDSVKTLPADYIGLIQFYLTLKGWYRAEIDGKWDDSMGFLLKNQEEKIIKGQETDLPSDNRYYGDIRFDRTGGDKITGFRGKGVVETEKYTIVGSFEKSELVEGSKLYKDGTIENGEYEDGKLVKGQKTHIDGTLEDGKYKDGLFIYGTRTYKDKTIEKGTFKEGKLYSGTKTMPNGEVYNIKDGEETKKETAQTPPTAPQAPATQGGAQTIQNPDGTSSIQGPTVIGPDLKPISPDTQDSAQTQAPATPKPKKKPSKPTNESTNKPEQKEHINGRELTKKTINSNKLSIDLATKRIQPAEEETASLINIVVTGQKPEDIKKLQKKIGTKTDGVFGKKSLDALVKYSEKFPELPEKKEEPKTSKAPEGTRQQRFDKVKEIFKGFKPENLGQLAYLVREVTEREKTMYTTGLSQKNHETNKAILEQCGWSGKEWTSMSKEEKTTLLKNVRQMLGLE